MESKTQAQTKLNPVSLTLLKVIVMGLIGIPFAYLFDRSSYSSRFLTHLSNEHFILVSFLYTLYAFFVMASFYIILGLRKKISAYMARDIVPLSKAHYSFIWVASIILACVCFAYVFIQASGRHPAFEALHTDYFGIKALRVEIGTTINFNVFNIGFKFFLPISLVLSLFFLKKKFYFLLSLLVFVLMSTFILEKGQIVSTIVLIIFFRMLFSKLAVKQLAKYTAIGLALISAMYFLTRFATDLPTLISGVSGRIIYGQIAELPQYFELFSDKKAPLSALLPPYISGAFGLEETTSAARLVMEHLHPADVAAGLAGVANSFFVGEAFAVAGHTGAVLSPFVVMANLVFCVFLFCGLKKNIYFVFLFSWFLYRIFDGIFGGISYFTLSGLHFVLLAIFYFLFSQTFVKNAKRLKSMARNRKASPQKSYTGL